MGANIRIPSPGLSSPICFEQNASAFPRRKSACRDLIIKSWMRGPMMASIPCLDDQRKSNDVKKRPKM